MMTKNFEPIIEVGIHQDDFGEGRTDIYFFPRHPKFIYIHKIISRIKTYKSTPNMKTD